MKVLSDAAACTSSSKADKLVQAAAISGGSPGFALQLLNSEGAKGLPDFPCGAAARCGRAAGCWAAFRHADAAAVADFQNFHGAVAGLAGTKGAVTTKASRWRSLHASLSQQQSVVSGYNVDRRVAVMDALQQVDLALKAA